MLYRLRAIAIGLGLIADAGDWLEPDRVLGCSYPRREEALRALSQRGISLLVNLHERAHPQGRLQQYGMREIHLPVPDFAAPTAEQLSRGVDEIRRAVARGERVAVHCGSGLGRTGTLLACYLVSQGFAPAAAIARVRTVRPGSIETRAQLAAVHRFLERHPHV